MLFNSINFMIFFPIVTFLYFVIPDRWKKYWLLLSSYYFYMCWNAKYIVLIIFSTVITYVSGLLLERIEGKQYESSVERRYKNYVVAGSAVLNLGVLFWFKYLNFALDLLGKVLARVHIEWNMPVYDIILPVGISFYTFQALSYTMDVYRDEIKAEHNFCSYALFVSFFPQLVAGPIERSKNLLKQMSVPHKFNYERAREGFLMMLWGFFLKIVLADRIALFVDTVYADQAAFPGLFLVVATVLFAIQIYCDFYGYTSIAIGTAKILGFTLMENFDAPYLSTSVSGFWRRWHISLTSWFKDYLYIPLGGNRKGKCRKYLNKMIVFLVSGLWHGADLSYVVWGGLNGLYQILEEIFSPLCSRLVKFFRLHRESLGHKAMKMILTFCLVDFTWIFFRAENIGHAFQVIRSMITVRNPWILIDGSLYKCGLDFRNFVLMLICIGVLLIADLCRRYGIVIRHKIIQQDDWVRWIIISLSVCAILTFGIWGPGYDATNFIYFQF